MLGYVGVLSVEWGREHPTERPTTTRYAWPGYTALASSFHLRQDKKHIKTQSKMKTVLKFQPAIFLLSKNVIRFHEFLAEAMQRILQ